MNGHGQYAGLAAQPSTRSESKTESDGILHRLNARAEQLEVIDNRLNNISIRLQGARPRDSDKMVRPEAGAPTPAAPLSSRLNQLDNRLDAVIIRIIDTLQAIDEFV